MMDIQDEISHAGDRVLEMVRIAIDRKILTADEIVNKIKPIRQKGRNVVPLPTFTFPGSGISCQVRRLGPFTMDAISRQVRAERHPPKPPIVMVNYGTEESPEWKTEENPADPNYKEALVEYERDIEEEGSRKIIDTIINHAIVVDIDYDEVQNMRSFLLDLGVSREELDAMSDHSIYVKHICIKSGEDLKQLQSFVIGESVPTEARVVAHEDSFLGEVQGEATKELHSTNVGNNSQHHT